MGSRQKLKEFLSVSGYSGKDRIAITTDPSDMGPTDRFNKGDDLGVEPETGMELLGLKNPENAGGLLGDFLKYLTDISQNAYKIEGGNVAAVSLNSRLGDGSGIGVPLEPSENQGAESVFVKTGESSTTTLGAVMAQYSNGYFPPEDLQKIISKDNVNPDLSGKHTQEMLAKIVGGDMNKFGATFSNQNPQEEEKSQAQILTSAQDILIRRSRFNPSYSDPKAFVPYPTLEGEFEDGKNELGTSTSQSEFGEYDTAAVTMIENNLRNIGASLLLKAAGMDSAGISPGLSTDPNPQGGFKPAEDSPIGKTAYEARDGSSIKISPSLLRSREAYGAPERPGDGESTRSGRGAWDTLLSQEETISSESFGSITTPDVMFSDEKNKDVLVAHASAAIAAMIIIANETKDSISGGEEARLSLGRGPYLKGRATTIATQAKFALLQSIVLVPTQHPYRQCVDKGFDVLFGGPGVSVDDVLKGKLQADNGVNPLIAESPVFWLSIARKIIRSCSLLNDELVQSFESSVSSGMSGALSLIQGSGILKILNVVATIGDISITMYGKTGRHSVSDPVGQWNVDRLPDGPSTRVSKSRSQSGQTSSALAWRGNSVPSLYMIPKNVIMASAKLGTLAFGQNPAKGMLGSSMIKNTYVDVNATGKSSRIPNDVVERMENKLDAEYVPFYFHDLRTNEIISFHAFLESLADSYNPQFSQSQGYGRVDPVQVYRNTTRNLSFSFYVASTSKEDFNEMWWKINKLTTMVYPQWSEGTKISTNVEGSTEPSTFIQPFSQVLGSSPVIRLRVGDVIKSNYSNFNLARIFGIGQDGISPKAEESNKAMAAAKKIGNLGQDSAIEAQLKYFFNAIYGSPIAMLGSVEMGAFDRTVRAAAAQLLINGFANPLGVAVIMRELQDPDSRLNAVPFSATAAGAIEAGAFKLLESTNAQNIFGYMPTSLPYLRASVNNGYLVDDDTGVRWRITHPLRVYVKSREVELIESTRTATNPQSQSLGPAQAGAPTQKTLYSVIIIDLNAPLDLLGKVFKVGHADLTPNPNTLFNTYTMATIAVGAAADLLVQTLANEAATLTGIPSDALDLSISSAGEFMRSDVNPIVRSFESTSGRGLAGVISSLRYSWLDATNTWEIDWNSRGPKYAKVTINFDVIHDIPPGLDYSGYDRAPIYNVGDTMQTIAGDPYRDYGRASHDSYRNQGRKSAQSNNADED